ncbi:hypothetical protein [Amycolatopsis sp. NPDC051903]|uniref:hypothetical protein n=1 Tax=Amycolatopsis sp. NPDC051903 TaxID=3363936 RepID=UPI0037ABB1BD
MRPDLGLSSCAAEDLCQGRDAEDTAAVHERGTVGKRPATPAGVPECAVGRRVAWSCRGDATKHTTSPTP